MSTFQFIVTTIFAAFILIGVGVFAIYGGVFGGQGVGQVTIWGTMPQAQVDYLLDALRSTDKSLQDVKYVEQSADTYQAVLLNAMASGQAPDLFMVTQEELGAFENKVRPIPYGAVSQSTFVSSYIDEGNLFLTPSGALALPFSVDPLVMYYNRDLLASAGVANAPQLWNDFLGLSPKLTSLDSSQNVKRAAVALGAWQNVSHAKEILSTLFMQAGEPVTSRNSQGALVAVFGQGEQGSSGTPAESALRFYTEFGNPSKTTYSWNRSLPHSDSAFSAGQLAVYFGPMSEYQPLVERNPNLRFGVTLMPQLQGSAAVTFGTLTGFAVPLGAQNPSGAMLVAQKLTSTTAAGVLYQSAGILSARRDTAPATAGNATLAVFVQSALISRGWVDPSPTETDQVFAAMINSTVSGAQEPAAAVSEAAQEFTRLLPPRH